MSKKWHFEREENIKEKPLVKELSKILGAKDTQLILCMYYVNKNPRNSMFVV